MNQAEEEQAIKLCQQGDSEEFGKLYDCYLSRIYSFVYYKVQQKETAEDLTSQIFIKAMEAIGTFDRRKGLFSSWLYRIARNKVIDYYRTRKGEVDVADIWGLRSRDDITRDLEIREKLKLVEGYLQKLSKTQREIVLMRIWDDLSYKEIAEILNRNEGSCKMAFSRVMRKLRKEQLLLLLIPLVKL